MKQLYLLAFILFVLLSLFYIYSRQCIKEGLSYLPQCDNNATCKEGALKCSEYSKILEKTDNISEYIKNKLNTLNDFVDKNISSLEKLEKQAKSC